MNRVLLDQEKVIRNREPWKCNRTGNHFTLFLDFFFFFHFFCNIATARKRKQYFVMVYCFRTCFLSWWTMINWNLSGFVKMLHLNHLIASSGFDPSFIKLIFSFTGLSSTKLGSYFHPFDEQIEKKCTYYRTLRNTVLVSFIYWFLFKNEEMKAISSSKNLLAYSFTVRKL